MKNQMESIMEPGMAAEDHVGLPRCESATSPYGFSLIGEYLRMLLLLVSVPLLLCFAQFALRQQLSGASMFAVFILLLTVVSDKGFAWLRSLLLVAMTGIVLAVVVGPGETFAQGDVGIIQVPNIILLVCLATASLCELTTLFHRRRVNE